MHYRACLCLCMPLYRYIVVDILSSTHHHPLASLASMASSIPLTTCLSVHKLVIT